MDKSHKIVVFKSKTFTKHTQDNHFTDHDHDSNNHHKHSNSTHTSTTTTKATAT